MSEQAIQNVQPAPAESDLGFWGRLINIYVNPRKAFLAIDNRPTWLMPMILIGLIGIVATQIMFPVIMQSQLERIRSMPNIPPEQMADIEKQFTENSAQQRIITLVSQVVAIPIMFLIISAVFYFVGSVLLGGDTKFKKVFSAFCWASCISILGTLVISPLVMAKGTFNVTISPALLLPDDSLGTPLYTLLSKFDFFTIWSLAVFALGFSIIYRFSVAKAYISVAVLWGIWIAISTAFAGIFSQFGM